MSVEVTSDTNNETSNGTKMPESQTTFSVEQIHELLPHRYPFALVDRIIEYVPGEKAVGIKKVSFIGPHFQGHFPSKPIMPGVLIVEAMAQVGGVVLTQLPGMEGKLFLFAVDGSKVVTNRCCVKCIIRDFRMLGRKVFVVFSGPFKCCCCFRQISLPIVHHGMTHVGMSKAAFIFGRGINSHQAFELSDRVLERLVCLLPVFRVPQLRTEGDMGLRPSILKIDDPGFSFQ